MNLARINAETIERIGPAPTNAVEALLHIVKVYEGVPEEDVMIMATSNVYGEGDLRELARLVAAKDGA